MGDVVKFVSREERIQRKMERLIALLASATDEELTPAGRRLIRRICERKTK